MQWVNRIKSKMKELGITQEELATKMGLTRGAITHYLAGRRVPPLRQFQKLAAILKSDPAWLQFGASAETSSPIKKNIKKEETNHRAIPLLSWEQVAEFPNVTKIKHEEIKEWVPHFLIDNPSWYALRIKGDSMKAPLALSKSFHEGDVIIVDPNKEVNHGDYVVAILPRSKEATFKQFVIDGGIRYLKPLNPQYPIITIDKGTHICGTVIYSIST